MLAIHVGVGAAFGGLGSWFVFRFPSHGVVALLLAGVALVCAVGMSNDGKG